MDNLQTTYKHWRMLFFACLLMFGNYYSYDLPGSINTQLKSWLNATDSVFAWQLNILYSVYSLPNIFLPLIGGILVDRLGPSSMLAIFSTIICIGQIVFALGINLKNFSTMVLGRLLFGLGGESLEVAQASITTDWFQGRGLAFALGLNISFARIATALNDNLSPWISNKLSVPVSGWIGVIACLISSFSSLIVIYLDQPKRRRESNVFYSSEEEEEDHRSNDEESFKDAHEDPFEDTPFLQNNQEEGYESEEYEEEDENVHFSLIFGFRFAFWLLFLNTIALYGSVQPFFHVCTEFFQYKWYKDDPVQAGFVMSIPDIISAIATPLCGYMVDRVGRRGELIIYSGVLIFVSLSLMSFTMITPIISMSILGLSYAVFSSALWPCVPFLVGRHQTATAYGVFLSIIILI